MDTYDIAVIGAGPGGYVAAISAAQRGAKVALIEKDALGGTCLNYGCIPTKTLFATAELRHKMNDAKAFGLTAAAPEIDWQTVIARKDSVVQKLTKGIAGLMKAHKVTVINGAATLASRTEIEITSKKETQKISADKIIIASGSKPARPKAFPFDDTTVMDSTSLLARKELPKSIIIVGGGYIGCEFASILNAVGVDVTVVEMLPTLLNGADADVQKAISRRFKKDKIKVITGAGIEDVKVKGNSVYGSVNGETISAETMLVAVGRVPYCDGLGCENAGVKTEKNAIMIDEHLRTSVANIYAIGDVTAKIQLAHLASHQAVVAAENATGGNATMDYSIVPGCIFTLPEIGSVGLTEADAAEKYENIAVGTFAYGGLGRALASNDTEGFYKIITNAATDEIVGVHIFGAHATDLAAEAALAMKLECTAEELGKTIHAHPTLSEGLMEAAHAVHGMCVHAPPARR